MTYSNKILLELTKHKRLNASQLATKITHDPTKTRYLADLMVRNDKLAVSADVDGKKGYEITKTGRLQIEHLITPRTHCSTDSILHHPWPAPEKGSATTATTPSKPTAPTTDEQPKTKADAAPNSSPASATINETPGLQSTTPRLRAAVNDTVSYGLLNTGQLILLLGGQHPLLLSAGATDAIRDLLNRGTN